MKRSSRSGLLLAIAILAACSHHPTAAPIQSLTYQPETASKPTSKNLETPYPIKTLRQFSAAPDRDLFQITKQLLPAIGDIPEFTTADQLKYYVGHSETFWLMDLSNATTYKSDFTLALITPLAYWYVDRSLDFSMPGLNRSAKHFEETIYPVITKVFGTERIPGIDNDPRLNILNARLTNVAGYFNSNDGYPINVRPKSNEREIIYVNAQAVPIGSANYDQVLAHELQHAIHWNADNSEDTWVNEGLSELASSLALGSTYSIQKFLQGPPVSLVHWPTTSANSTANYGAASLFMHFFTEHYSNRKNLKDLVSQEEDSIAGIDRYLKDHGYEEDFEDIFEQWASANILDQNLHSSSKLLRYEELEVKASVSESVVGLMDNRSHIPQYAVEYTELRSISQPFQLSFQGDSHVALLPVDVGHSGCWWSNSGDSIDSTLSHHIRIPINSKAILEYEIWFDIEENWDYLYIEISVDGGSKWRIVETSKTSTENPFGNSFGSGYTGKSGGWLTDSVDLSPFSDEDFWIRFQYVTDDAVNAAGACLRNISVSGSALTADDYDWKARGFEFIDNVVPQHFQVQLITVGANPNVRKLALNPNNFGKWTIQPPSDGQSLILAVGSLAEKTREPAGYSISLAAVY